MKNVAIVTQGNTCVGSALGDVYAFIDIHDIFSFGVDLNKDFLLAHLLDYFPYV